MRCGLCGFLIIKLQTALHHAVWCGTVHYYLQCGAVLQFYGRFWCGFYDLCGLVNTPNFKCLTKKKKKNKTSNWGISKSLPPLIYEVKFHFESRLYFKPFTSNYLPLTLKERPSSRKIGFCSNTIIYVTVLIYSFFF